MVDFVWWHILMEYDVMAVFGVVIVYVVVVALIDMQRRK